MRKVFHPLNPRGRWLALTCAIASVGLLGCQDDENQNVPNRVLDRPLDVTLACAEVVECGPDDDCIGVRGAPRTLSECNVPSQDSRTCTEVGRPQMVGFVANSERNEVAMFTECSGELIDMDRATPGYQFIPVGTLPSSMATSTDGCRVITSNAGSCDLTLLDAPALATYGLGPDQPREEEPSRFVSYVQPQRFDTQQQAWIPVAARVGQILPVRSSLSGSRGVDAGVVTADTCSPGAAGSVYVTFPTCDLVAEVDLVTEQILQSYQFLDNGDGTFDVLDTGTSPVCQVDCWGQFGDGTTPSDLDQAVVPTVRPTGIEFVGTPIDTESSAYFDVDDQIADNTLFVGGIGADVVFEIRMEDDGEWIPEVHQLELQRAGGIERIRATPVVDYGGLTGQTSFQYLYLIAGDGSTRVVSRDLPADRTRVGVECETNLDPFTLEAFGATPPCVPVTPSPDGTTPASRAPTAVGPGIRPRRGGRITDWYFSRVPKADPSNGESQPGQEEQDLIVANQGGEGEVTGMGVTSLGGVLAVKFQQYTAMPATPPIDNDPLQLITHRLAPNTLDPERLPRDRLRDGSWSDSLLVEDGGGSIAALPQVANQEPVRTLPGDTGIVRDLAPSLRLVDWAYAIDNPGNRDVIGAEAGPDGATMEPITRASALGNVRNVDHFAGDLLLSEGEEEGYFYDEDVVRIVPRDYARFPTGEWVLSWEPEIPGTGSSTGVLSCSEAAEGWPKPNESDTPAAFCNPVKNDDTRTATLRDESATFCDDGVLPGDKLLIIGCSDDGDCGPGRSCLQASAAGGDSTGVCISTQALEDQEEDYWRALCGEFISDPCGEAYREYEIVHATQTELELAALEVPFASTVRGEIESDAADPDSMVDFGKLDDFGQGIVEETGQFICTQEQPETGCVLHSDCTDFGDGDENTPPLTTVSDIPRATYCVDGKCQRRCDRALGECRLREVPASACFRELISYQVRARNQFVLSGPGSAAFFSDRVLENDQGECVAAGPTEQISGLLTSRIPVGPTDAELGLPACPDGDTAIFDPGAPNPCVIQRPRGDGNSRFHCFDFRGETVTAIRFTNPFFTIVLDLVDLDSLASEIPSEDGLAWSRDFATFRRARIPRGYRVTFDTFAGYNSFEYLNPEFQNEVSSTALIFPVRMVGRSPNSPTAYNVAFVVDAAGTGTNTGLRGQVMRFGYQKPIIIPDGNFDGVR